MDRLTQPVFHPEDCFILPQPPTQILLAEDDQEMRAMIAVQLRDDGYDVIEARNGVELMRAARRFEDALLPFDLIVTDIRMPGWNGLEALDHLRRSGNNVPVIVMTAFGDARIHALAESLGAAVVLDKPFDLDDLRTAVARLIEPPSAPAPPTS